MKIIRFDTNDTKTNITNLDYVYSFVFNNRCDFITIIDGYDDSYSIHDFNVYTDFRKLAIICDKEEYIRFRLNAGDSGIFDYYYRQLFEYSPGHYISESDLLYRLEKIHQIVDIDELICDMKDKISKCGNPVDKIKDMVEYVEFGCVLDRLNDIFVKHSLSNWMYDTISGKQNCFIEKYAKDQIKELSFKLYNDYSECEESHRAMHLIGLSKFELIDIGNDMYNAKLIGMYNEQRRNG